ncbi:hypothetical protein FE633_13450 [Streptomyces montanus]|uniref:Helix-turn-helix domain-containing protein n=1 Tax=Streptomyces montanus TaxID=2580423 RepID=A0A5R9FPA2_9ACTN|nr:hypothetical protein [Streptomyces montanus]TLS45762.1 hypothetical protein FE633_13450 [Streptomyces montanus]
MMHDVLLCRHIKPVARVDVSKTASGVGASGRSFDLVHDASAHEISTTASRQLRGGADFLAAARFMVGSGFHLSAGPTTLRLAEVFAARMGRSKDGTFPFSVEATARELGLKRRAVFNHARYLRELGLLAYAEHGSKRNALRTRYGARWIREHGYRGTATLFAAVAPRVWDDAMGRRIRGEGYTARQVGVTDAGRELAVAAAGERQQARLRKQQAEPVENSRSCTPSFVVPQDGSHLKVEGGSNYTSRRRATRTDSADTTGQERVSATECARGIATAEQLQREVWWLNRGCARRLAHALRPLIAAGWAWQSLAAELLTWGVPGYLRDPAAYVRHELARRRQHHVWPHLAAPVVCDDQVDERGERRQEMLRRRGAAHSPAWQRYAEQLRPELRRRLAEGRQARQAHRLQSSAYRPMWREPEEHFLASLPDQAWAKAPSPLEIYAARAWRRPAVVPDSGTLPAGDQGWLEHLRDQAEAERACAVLRAELENWEAERR